jgi:plasmid stabilization system protein ParE
MNYILEVSQLAEADFADAVRWYGRIRPGLAADFVLCVDEALDRIMHNPYVYAPLFLTVRRAVLRRFPYGVIYRVIDTHVKIEAFFPDKMDPNALQRRLA